MGEASDLVRYWNRFARQLQSLCVERLREQCPFALKDNVPQAGIGGLGRIGGEDRRGVGRYQGLRVLCIGLQIQRANVNCSSHCLGGRAVVQEAPAIRQEKREKLQAFFRPSRSYNRRRSSAGIGYAKYLACCAD